MTESMPTSIFGNFLPLGTNLGINFFEKVFNFFKAHIKRQLWVAISTSGVQLYFVHSILLFVKKNSAQRDIASLLEVCLDDD